MEHRHLGNSGMVVSAISYGNWITHGGQVEEDAAIACVRAALDAGITTFDHGRRLRRRRRREGPRSGPDRRAAGLHRDLHQGLLAHRTESQQPRPVPQAHPRVLRHVAPSSETDHLDLLQAHRYDVDTPLEETLRAFDDLVRMGKVHYIGVSEWSAARSPTR